MKTSFADLSHEDVDRILEIVNKLQDVDLHLQVGEISLHVRKGETVPGRPDTLGADTAAPVLPRGSSVAVGERSAEPENTSLRASRVAVVPESDLIDIVAPMLGRFYRSSSPNDPPFVEVGARLGAEDTVCIIEVMKLFNTVPGGVSGEVVEIVAQDGQMVEEGDVLFKVKPL